MAVVHVIKWLIMAGLIDLAVFEQIQNHHCPSFKEITPCLCSTKKNGLDILCENTKQLPIINAMSVLKGKNLIIFYLKLRHNNLPKLPGFIFLGLDISHLIIYNCSLSVMHEEALSSVGKMLTQLDVSQNLLSTIPSQAYENLHHLFVLNMNHNKITHIHAKAFQGLDTLEILSLYENSIGSIDDEAFYGLGKKLRRLNLGGNKLTEIPQKALYSLETLKKLELQENRIKEIHEGDFQGLGNLDSLGLAHNRLKELPARVFSHLNQLNSLELEGNNIVDIDPEAFFNLEENLQYLRLGDNKIQTIPSEALRPLRRLRHLDLRSNDISTISEEAFFGYGDSITFLNLKKNNIQTLPPLIFENLNSLETLNLENNKLTVISEDIMDFVMDTLTSLDIMGNPLRCDCDLQWYNDWTRRLKNRDEDIYQRKPLTCYMEQEHREYRLQNLPLDKMGCAPKVYDISSSNIIRQINVIPLIFCTLLTTYTIQYINLSVHKC